MSGRVGPPTRNGPQAGPALREGFLVDVTHQTAASNTKRVVAPSAESALVVSGSRTPRVRGRGSSLGDRVLVPANILGVRFDIPSIQLYRRFETLHATMCARNRLLEKHMPQGSAIPRGLIHGRVDDGPSQASFIHHETRRL